MVTGVETAGLVLGSIPLVVSALEHYAEGVTTITKWWSYKRELASLVRVLDAEYARFLGTCEKLLEGLIAPDEMEKLIAFPGGDLWKNHELDRKLKSRLDRSYSSYLRSVEDMAEAINSLKAKLELDSSGKPLWGDYHTFKHEYKRVKFSLSRRRYEESMKRIEKNNDILANLTDQNIELEPIRKRRRLPAQKFKTIQAHAGSLYSLIKRGWTCDCGSPHDANLQLDARLLDDTRHGLEANLDNVQFRVLFSVNHRSRSEAILWSWLETEIRLLDRQSQGLTKSTVLKSEQTPVPAIAQSSLKSAMSHRELDGNEVAKVSALSGPVRKSVKFGGPQLGSEIDKLCVTMAKQDLSDFVEIRNICLVMQQCMRNIAYNQRCLGYLCAEGCQPLGVYLPQASKVAPDQHSVSSLAELLTKGGSKSSGRLVSTAGSHLLSRGDRLGLALTIASSVLQLYKTPWLRDDWNKHDILINDTGKVLYREQAYISGAFSATAMERMTQQKMMAHLVRNETLFALGLVLIELCLGQVMESMRTPEDPLDVDQKPNILTDLYTANRLMEDVYNEGGRRYGDAVRRCIYCEFDQRRTSLDDDKFRQAVYDGVVAPLEDDVKDFYQLN